ncbi:MAG: oligosaccharide flippase family protein [Alphaproteobacteria bacterium]|nr:oligosaccharide flippase family protein [Alphaproteobacteria bacterium]
MFTARRSDQDALNLRVLSSDQPTGPLGGRTMRGGAIAVGAQVLRMVLQIGGVSALAHLLAPDQFGLVAMGSTVTVFVSVLTDLNMATAAIQREKLDQQTASGMFFYSFAMGLATLAIAMIAIPPALWIFKDSRLTFIIIGLAATTPISALGSMHQALMMRNMKWLDVHALSIASLAFGTLVSVLAAWKFNAGYWALIIQSWTTAASFVVLAWIRCPWRPSLVHDWSGAKSTLKFGLNLSAAMILNYFARQMDNVLIGWRWGPTALGYYSRAYSLLQTPLNFLTGPLGSTMVPAMSQLRNEPEKWRKAYLDALAVITAIGGGMACLLYGGAGTIIDILLGPGWDESKQIFSNLALAMLAATPMRTTGWIYISLGRTNRMLQWGLIGVPMYIAAFIIGLPYGGEGVALSYSISQLIAFAPCMWMATRDTNITMKDIVLVVAFPTLATIAVGLGLATATAHLGLMAAVAAIAAAGLVYVALAALALWRVPVYERLRSRAVNMADKVLRKPNALQQ